MSYQSVLLSTRYLAKYIFMMELIYFAHNFVCYLWQQSSTMMSQAIN